ncbi:cell wall-associated NlpC family hydrolase [Tamaricihabitans halophyticus]|uniref:Cell wall-associated NlpC family hydrolase n=1 Tax=Tamaricihabitans halophyticus TaxID=1262583 RepID=A0A4V2SUP4_9PSEU|nr:C40 family peptidase [Tamaricihabitans halophyticus]TCP55106.1 cell wall-associated NlpC family hydrolase [Tamaricihabitans halophyticus]
MASHRLKRSVRGALAASAVIVAVGYVSAPAIADPVDDPAPGSQSEALTKYRELSTEAEKLNERHLKAQDDLTTKQGDLRTANADLAKAKTAERQALKDQEQFRGHVDELADASFQGARFNRLSALLTGDSAQDFLDRSSALSVLAEDKAQALERLSGAVQRAETARKEAGNAQQRAETARNGAAKLAGTIEERKEALESQITEVQEAAGLLSSADQAEMSSEGVQGTFLAPAGAAGDAMNAALGKRGSPYVWGATGPNEFDCSGLTSWAYQQAGVSIPRSSSAQSQHGQSVSPDAMQPGDLVFYGSPVHHVGIYVGGGNMVHAPTTGDVVKVSPLQDNLTGVRRVAG